ncbi:hypothetical protein VN97_g7567 [Penicillium thymicola]|uniref:Uncharacterized protein n=1 Tax=Penicillium thymicola TaxID=293382 RepID=A0AAI9TFG0_PENTH|nr:hypothetical protein VN97_g7567 [Penicillium thymicola]
MMSKYLDNRVNNINALENTYQMLTLFKSLMIPIYRNVIYMVYVFCRLYICIKKTYKKTYKETSRKASRKTTRKTLRRISKKEDLVRC